MEYFNYCSDTYKLVSIAVKVNNAIPPDKQKSARKYENVWNKRLTEVPIIIIPCIYYFNA